MPRTQNRKKAKLLQRIRKRRRFYEAEHEPPYATWSYTELDSQPGGLFHGSCSI